jgi:two-component system response regulator PhoP
MRILLIEDEVALREQIRQRLSAAGYTVDGCGDGREGLYLAREYPVDLAVVDLGLPGLSGLDLIRTLRSEGQRLPLLVLTARGKWEEKVAGLEAGADDYLVKPFHMEELLARIKALLRRAAAAGSEALQRGPFVIDIGAQRVRRGEAAVDLTTFEYRLLEYLARHGGRVISKGELADYLHDHADERDSNVIEVLVGRLRRKLDPDNQWQIIETVRGRGYRFNAGLT